jgi:hypothetical protein
MRMHAVSYGEMLSLGLPVACAYIALGLVALYKLPAWGRSILALMRDLDDYRAKREKR